VKKNDKLPKLRQLYVDGHTMAAAARMCGVSRNTAAAWRAEDEAANGEWDAARSKKLAQNPRAPLDALRERIEWMIAHEAEFRDDPGYDDRLNKALLNLERLEARFGDSGHVLRTLNTFAKFVVTQNPSDAELAAVRKYVEACMTALQAGTWEVLP